MSTELPGDGSDSEGQAAAEKYKKGMKGLGQGLVLLGCIQLLIGIFSLLAGGKAGIVICLLGLIFTNLGVGALLRKAWVNVAVIITSSALVLMNCVMMGLSDGNSTSKKTGSPGSALGFFLAIAIIYFAAQNLSARKKAIAAGVTL